MKTLITGATGFIGSAVLREAMRRGMDVKVLVRATSNTKNIDEYDVERVVGDITDYDSMRRAMEGCDSMITLAADFHHFTPDPEYPYKMNVDGTKTVLRAALDAGLSRVVYMSSIVTVGAHGAEKVNEDARFNLDVTGDHYSISKYFGEVEAFKFGAKGLPIIILNPTLVIGSHDIKPTPSGRMIQDIARGKSDMVTPALLNIVDADDVAVAACNALTMGRLGERYILGTTNISAKDYYNMAADVAGVRRPRFNIPYPIALAAAHVYEYKAKKNGTQPEIAVTAIKIGHMGEQYDCSKAIDELNMPQTPLEETLKKAIDWFRENGYLEEDV